MCFDFWRFLVFLQNSWDSHNIPFDSQISIYIFQGIHRQTFMEIPRDSLKYIFQLILCLFISIVFPLGGSMLIFLLRQFCIFVFPVYLAIVAVTVRDRPLTEALASPCQHCTLLHWKITKLNLLRIAVIKTNINADKNTNKQRLWPPPANTALCSTRR